MPVDQVAARLEQLRQSGGDRQQIIGGLVGTLVILLLLSLIITPALALLERSVNGDEEVEFLVVAANHGQILERLRDLGDRQNRVHPLRKPVQDAFLQYGAPPDGLAIFDLSRTTRRESLSEVLRAVAGHTEWDNCSRCSLQADGRVCPISENRARVLGERDGGLFARRLGDVVEVARLNGWHLPVRDLLALVSNMILGHSNPKEAKEGLMACSDIAKIQEKGSIENASLYGNVFGSNLPSCPMARCSTAATSRTANRISKRSPSAPARAGSSSSPSAGPRTSP